MEHLCLRNLLDHPDERIFFKDEQGRFLAVSAGYVASLAPGLTREQVIGKTDFDIFSAEHANDAFEDERRLMASGEPLLEKIERETFEDRPDAWAATSKLPLRDEHGAIIGSWGISRDITAKVEVEQALHDSQEQLRASELQHRLLFEHNPQPVFVYDIQTREIVAASNAAVASYGYSREELLSMTAEELRPTEDRAEFLRVLASRKRHAGLEMAQPRRHQYKDGTVIDVEVTSDDLTFAGRECRIALCQNVTERNRADAELATARDEAVDASNMKSAFLANVSHEIRTPMNGVIGMTELLLATALTEEQRSYAAQVASSGEQMLALINDILDVAKIEAGQLELDIDDIDLHETIEQACATARVQAGAAGIELHVTIEDSMPRHVRGDSRRLRQVLLNLVANAVKFTAAGEVSVRASGHPLPQAGELGVRVEVSDTGIGIDPAVVAQMFEPFTQADASTTRTYGGTGLGLAIVRELVELMGGTVGCESQPGLGSTFSFEVPLKLSSRAAESAAAAQDGSAAAPVLAWSSTPCVLVVEDSPVNQVVAVRTLERCGCEAEIANDGRQALEALARRRYDAVLMDCQMPGMDGYEATAELRRREVGGPRTPVIAMTAHAMKGDAERCLAAGMDDYIAKPMRRQVLADALARWIPHADPAAAGSGEEATSAEQALPAHG
jgi:two-component system sensor histidine kinase/response regulator